MGVRKQADAPVLIKQAEKFHRPVICLIDTSGAYCGIGAEERGQGQAIAENLMEMMTLQTPVISLLIGEGGSGGALALAAADRVWMLENAVYSVISPEGCASILWKDPKRASEAAEQLKLTARDALAGGMIERIIPEEGLGKAEFYESLRQAFSAELAELLALDTPALLEARYQRFRRIGRELRRGDRIFQQRFCFQGKRQEVSARQAEFRSFYHSITHATENSTVS